MDKDPRSHGCAACIVTYNPDLDRLAENLAAIVPQVDEVLVFDNASANVADVEDVLARACVDVLARGTSTRGVASTRGDAGTPAAHDTPAAHGAPLPHALIRNPRNAGLAVALNALARQAIDEGHRLALLLDQDSVAAPDLVEVETAVMASSDDIAIVCPDYVDRNTGMHDMRLAGDLDTRRAMTSGSLLRLSAFEQVGGYDERLFVDWVDHELGMNLRLHGWRLVQTSRTSVLHELGHQEYALRLPRRKPDGSGWEMRVYNRFNYPPARNEDLMRSRVLTVRKYKGTPLVGWEIKDLVVNTLKNLLVEKHKLALVKAYARGFREGMR